MEHPFIILSQVARILEDEGITYVVVGSVASSLHGLYRTTGDIDIVAEITVQQIVPLVSALQTDFYIDEQAIRRAVAGHRSFNALHFETVFKVDIFIPPPDSFSRQQLLRRRAEQLAPELTHKFYVATPEDTVLGKLLWYRAGKEVSITQWNDVAGIIGTQGAGLDIAYLKEWADRFNVRDLLDKVLDETL
jgi:hypothetical protein